MDPAHSEISEVMVVSQQKISRPTCSVLTAYFN